MKNKVFISIVGFGNVGQTIAKEFLDHSFEFNLNIMDPLKSSEASVEEMRHATAFDKIITIEWNNTEWFNKSDFIIICAAKQSTVIGDRLKQSENQIKMLDEIFENYKPIKNPFYIVISNPVDIMTYHVWKKTKAEEDKVIGTGTSLEKLRFDFYLSKNFQKDLSQVDGWILGEHGNSAVLIYSKTKIKGINPKENIDILNKSFNEAIQAPYKIRTMGVFTKFGISKCVWNIFRGIYFKESVLMPAGVVLNDENCRLLNTKKIVLSTPLSINNGIPKQLSLNDLDKEEIEKVSKSCNILLNHL